MALAVGLTAAGVGVAAFGAGYVVRSLRGNSSSRNKRPVSPDELVAPILATIALAAFILKGISPAHPRGDQNRDRSRAKHSSGSRLNIWPF